MDATLTQSRDLALRYTREITDWKGRELHVLEALIRRIEWPTYRAWPSKASLQEETGLSRKTVQRALKTLKEAGEIRQTGTLPMVSFPSRYLIVYSFPRFERWNRSLVVERFADHRGLHKIVRTPVPVTPEEEVQPKTPTERLNPNVNTSGKFSVLVYLDTGDSSTSSGATPEKPPEKSSPLEEMLARRKALDAERLERLRVCEEAMGIAP